MYEISNITYFPAQTGLLIFSIHQNSEKIQPADEIEVYPQAPFQFTRS